jgi:hypothetical protein
MKKRKKRKLKINLDKSFWIGVLIVIVLILSLLSFFPKGLPKKIIEKAEGELYSTMPSRPSPYGTPHTPPLQGIGQKCGPGYVYIGDEYTGDKWESTLFGDCAGCLECTGSGSIWSDIPHGLIHYPSKVCVPLDHENDISCASPKVCYKGKCINECEEIDGESSDGRQCGYNPTLDILTGICVDGVCDKCETSSGAYTCDTECELCTDYSHEEGELEEPSCVSNEDWIPREIAPLPGGWGVFSDGGHCGHQEDSFGNILGAYGDCEEGVCHNCPFLPPPYSIECVECSSSKDPTTGQVQAQWKERKEGSPCKQIIAYTGGIDHPYPPGTVVETYKPQGRCVSGVCVECSRICHPECETCSLAFAGGGGVPGAGGGAARPTCLPTLGNGQPSDGEPCYNYANGFEGICQGDITSGMECVEDAPIAPVPAILPS